jgi:hypothetical protein
MPYTLGKRTGGLAEAKVDFLRAGLARHLHDLARRRAAHDGIVDQQNDLVLELDAMGFSFWRTLFLRSACPGMMNVRPM